MMIGEKEYRTIETLPEFAKQQLAEQFRVSLATPDPDDPNRFLGNSAPRICGCPASERAPAGTA